MRFWRLVVAAACLVVVALSGWWWLRPVRPPNVLFITLDTTRADRIGAYGYSAARTPRLDRLAMQGVLFERAYAPAPMTAPSHASMFTGLWPPEHGVYTNATVALGPEVPVLADELRKRGYSTTAFVASVVLQAKSGFERGFDLYDDDLSSSADDGDDHHRSRDGKLVVDAAVRWLGNRPRPESPFLCWVHLFDPHHPYLPHTDEFGEAFQERPYDGEIAYVDRLLDRLFATLDKLELSEDTVIVVVGDHGESLGQHGEDAHGYLLHNSTLHVPLIIVDPRQKHAGGRVAAPVSLIDLFPTLSQITGLPDATKRVDRSLVPALRGEEISPRACYSQTLEPFVEAGWAPLQGLTTDRWRYVRTTRPELYDLVADPGELNNLAEREPEQVRTFEAELTALERTFQLGAGRKSKLSEREIRSLESLGYTGRGAADPTPPDGAAPRADIKDMIGPLHQLFAAQGLAEQQRYGEAADLLEPLASSVPGFVRARFTLGMCRLKQDRFDQAARWLEAAIELDPDHERARTLAGFAYLKLRKLPEAEAHLQYVVDANPDAENAHLFLGEIAQRQEKFPLAMRHYSEALRINPRNRQARTVLQALHQAGFRP
jgi:arylsulfatase A-like enzyme